MTPYNVDVRICMCMYVRLGVACNVLSDTLYGEYERGAIQHCQLVDTILD